ncbi:unnamed protein product [Schistosoma curassoni]|uniref:Uncharacterized protein n=1 Tax=Schistosoma curassoni TaxID=6186 RepID=A0A183KK19_9TREM|nr:unnamed protein product [Schistosoma curassoni]
MRLEFLNIFKSFQFTGRSEIDMEVGCGVGSGAGDEEFVDNGDDTVSRLFNT